MAVRSHCPYSPECEAPCTEQEIGRYIGLAAPAERRSLLLVLDDLEGSWVPFDDFLVHLEALSQHHGLEEVPADPEALEFPLLEDLGLLEFDRGDGRFLYHGCPLVSDIVGMVTH